MKTLEDCPKVKAFTALRNHAYAYDLNLNIICKKCYDSYFTSGPKKSMCKEGLTLKTLHETSECLCAENNI